MKYDSQKSSLDGVVRAKFVLVPGTDIRRFQKSLVAVYKGEADDEEVSYVLNNVADIICGHSGRH